MPVVTQPVWSAALLVLSISARSMASSGRRTPLLDASALFHLALAVHLFLIVLFCIELSAHTVRAH